MKPDHFVVTAGRFEIGRKLQIGETVYMVEKWGGCGKDFISLGLRCEDARAFLVVPDSVSWDCLVLYPLF